MIHGFQEETAPLTDYERDVLLPIFCRCLSDKVGEGRAVKNKYITQAMRNAGYKLSEARVRKIINHIRTRGLVKWLVATSKGYYIATSSQDVENYIDSLRGREEAIRAVRQAMEQQLQLKQN